MKALRRWAVWIGVPLALATLAGYGWYQLSDTGKRWRYESKLETYCGGVLPYEETVSLAGMGHERALPHDIRLDRGDHGYDWCKVAGLYVTVSRLPARVPFTDTDWEHYLPEEDAKALPIPLGGGWRGFTDLTNTAVVLPCRNRDTTLVVTAVQDYAHRPGKIAELVTATAAKAAERWDCDTTPGGPLPPIPKPLQDTLPSAAQGTCSGLPFTLEKHVTSVAEAPSSDAAPLEICVLKDEINYRTAEEVYRLEAAFGPYAANRHAQAPYLTEEPAGGSEEDYWASARCPDDIFRAIFRIRAQTRETNNPGFAKAALIAFAKRAAQQHGCTDLKLPR
ncbi:hypothetical protein ACIRNI_02955 [Streptomyces sp. NPDC093546]|uniref:hypothetical protein n=1 Tax=Streptomyces sp. NPDC093546 TaxID=3366040 RepID=UPI003809B19B